MMNKSLRGSGRESSRKPDYGFQRGDGRSQKKSRRFRRLLKLITGRRQTEWTGATRCPKEDNHSHREESLTDCKRAKSSAFVCQLGLAHHLHKESAWLLTSLFE